MAERDFFSQGAKDKVRDTIKKVELQTSAEVVVAVQKHSDSYRQTDLSLGFALAFATLLLLLFLPRSFAVLTMPLEVAVAFALGFGASSMFWGLKRRLTARSRMKEQAWRLACTLFVKLGISRTSGRNGILVVVSMLERTVSVVYDIGIDPQRLGGEWDRALDGMRRAVVKGADFSGFIASLESLGPVLGAQMPRAEDDVNELPDEMVQ
jgi:putative membrane protein